LETQTINTDLDLPGHGDAVTDDLLAGLRQVQSDKSCSLPEVIMASETISEGARLEILSRRYRMAIVKDIQVDQIPSEVSEKVAIQFLKTHGLLPFKANDGRGFIATWRPDLCFAADDLAARLNWTIYESVLCPPATISTAINQLYDTGRHSAEQIVQDLEDSGKDLIGDLEKTADLLDDTSDAPIVKLVNQVITQSIKARASDIHIEPYQDSLCIRHRVDGILYDLVCPPKRIQSAITSRIKVMASLNIAEKRLPQDGRIEIRIGEKEVDVRVSTIPTTFGERVVLRLLNKSGAILDMTEIGLAPEPLRQLRQLARQPHGIILVTGPTGSGKTTSLYSILSDINKPNINIMTIEDPVEYQIRGISQIQVNPKIDLTFARGLRSIVRQDPDVILVGEIRDRETAEIAIQSALTGHLVFSTLHTNDSASSITRLVDIGAEPFLISSSVIAVVAQRLVRVLCRHCKTAYRPDDTDLSAIGITRDMMDGRTFYRAVGCEDCLQTGFRGRSGIFEILTLDSELKQIILQTFDANKIKATAVEKGMVTLRQDGVQKVLVGATTIAEVLRVTHH
jgi:general secretion pathway protein E